MPNTNNKPDYKAYTSVQGNNGKSYYHVVGAAWNVAKGGISIDLFATPVNGQIVLFPPKEAPAKEEE